MERSRSGRKGDGEGMGRRVEAYKGVSVVGKAGGKDVQRTPPPASTDAAADAAPAASPLSLPVALANAALASAVPVTPAAPAAEAIAEASWAVEGGEPQLVLNETGKMTAGGKERWVNVPTAERARAEKTTKVGVNFILLTVRIELSGRSECGRWCSWSEGEDEETKEGRPGETNVDGEELANAREKKERRKQTRAA